MYYFLAFIQFYINIIVKSWSSYFRLNLTLFSLENRDGVTETLKIQESEEKKKYLQKVGQYFWKSSDFH